MDKKKFRNDLYKAESFYAKTEYSSKAEHRLWKMYLRIEQDKSLQTDKTLKWVDTEFFETFLSKCPHSVNPILRRVKELKRLAREG